MDLVGTELKFYHPTTNFVLPGLVHGVQVQTGELRVERLDDNSFLYIKPDRILV